MRTISGAIVLESEMHGEGGGGGYCGGICGYYGPGCSSSGYSDCSCSASSPLMSGFCRRHG
ncbi:hypothetical protein [Chryseobacterium sp. MYb328]|uniref:hypothetical protein n=1 Tax=Chryseobacterium sp. MYb328 TaxID=2745231 RepID=UPI0030B3260D